MITATTYPSSRELRATAAHLVESVRGEMDYLGWFTAIANAYPDNPHDWATARQTAASVRRVLDQAETLLRADHTTVRPKAAGALQQAAA